MLKHSGYQRTGIETITTEMFGDAKITDALTKEVMIVSYDYASHEPRLFSKFTASNYKLYDILIRDAAQASSAAPIYFDPKVIGN
jgi:patatin-like phospholipase/acyl hydrolase